MCGHNWPVATLLIVETLKHGFWEILQCHSCHDYQYNQHYCSLLENFPLVPQQVQTNKQALLVGHHHCNNTEPEPVSFQDSIWTLYRLRSVCICSLPWHGGCCQFQQDPQSPICWFLLVLDQMSGWCGKKSYPQNVLPSNQPVQHNLHHIDFHFWGF